MARAAADKLYRSFKAGFITEATGLTYPEDSCRDINNCDIELDGTARRRLGLNQELNGYTIGSTLYADTNYNGLGGPESVSTGGVITVPAEELAISYHIWRNPGAVAGYNFIVFQIGNMLIVRNYDSEPVSDPNAIGDIVTGPVEFQIDDATTGFIYNDNKAEAAKVDLQSSSGYGRLWFTSSHVVPFFMEFDPDTATLSLSRVETLEYGSSVHLAIRDFTGVDDGLEIDEEPGTLSNAHKYNLINQGWGSDEWDEYFADVSRYPSNAQQWVLGKDAMGDFNGFDLEKQDFGNSRAPRGHVVFDALTGRKTATDPDGTGSVTLTNEWEPATRGFATTAFFAGRVWLAGDENPHRPNGVYFSKILEGETDAGILMQVNDPTSEHFFDLLATDGGVIYIPEADHITKLEAFGAGLLVFARNGAWIIYGGEGGFTATTYSVEKVSSTGVKSPLSVVRTDQFVGFWADNGVHALVLPESGIIPVLQDISLDKVYKFYNAINKDARANACGTFDPISKKVFWFYLDLTTYPYPSHRHAYNAVLIFDTRTGAFTKYDFQHSLEAPIFTPSVAFPRASIIQPVDLNNPVEVNGDPVVVNGDPVVIGVAFQTSDEFLASLKVVVLDSDLEAIRITEFNDITFIDYQTMVTLDPQDYVSDITTGDEILADAQRNKQTTYVHTFFRRTETGMMTDDDGNLVYERPSACLASGRWDWHVSANGNRWSTPQKAYRYRRPFVPVDINDDVDIGDEIVYTRLKIRGKGKALSMHFESVSRHDFQLLGWSAQYTANGT